MEKHAYLIMLHKYSYLTEALLQAIDHPNNDIYIHVDAKATTFDISRLCNNVKYSNIYVSDKRINVIWGAYSLIETELLLMMLASENNIYHYYHILSGQDLPLKSQNVLHKFFSDNYGTEFITYHIANVNKESACNIYKRVAVDHFLRKYRNRYKSKLLNNIIEITDKLISGFEAYILKVDRCKEKQIPLAFGSQWISITHSCVKYILSKKDLIYEWFHYSSLGDELFVQTIIKFSVFYNKTAPNMRKIVFNLEADKKGRHQYIWRVTDYDELMN